MKFEMLGDLAALAYKDVICEPVVCEGNAEVPALVTDLGIRGVWLPQTELLLDIRVADVDAPSYLTCSVGNVLAMAEEGKNESMYLLLKPVVDLFLSLCCDGRWCIGP